MDRQELVSNYVPPYSVNVYSRVVESHLVVGLLFDESLDVSLVLSQRRDATG